MLELTTQLRSQDVKIDGKRYTLTELTGKERDAYETALITINPDGTTEINRDSVKATLIQMALKDEAGEPAFSVEQINAMPSRVTRALSDAVLDMSGIDEDAVEDAGKD